MINFDDRLKSLKDRRQGSKQRAIFESSFDSIQKNRFIATDYDIRQREIYENLRESNSVKYAIGAMAPVDRRSTEISFEEGERVAKSLINSLNSYGIQTDFRFQGSCALDIHIEGHSDVDVLIIKKDIIQVDLSGSKQYTYSSDPRSMTDMIKEIRIESEGILPKNFPKTEVNISGNKSIAMDKGSLKRKVDVVPACWYDTKEYQHSSLEKDRGIKIYHKGDHVLHLNLPFKHINLISNRDNIYNGNLRSVIRLMKNMVADMPEYKKTKAKKLSSYDLAAIAYHMGSELVIPFDFRLGLVEKTRAHLNNLVLNKTLRDSIYVPDGSRKIFDDENYAEKVDALRILSSDMQDLAESIFKDIKPNNLLGYNNAEILSKRIA